MTRVGLLLVRRPGPRLDGGLVTHVERRPVDLDLALEQWANYLHAFRSAGWEVLEVNPADDCPDAVFIEDTMVVFGDMIVITRPGALSRRSEIPGARAAADASGLPVFQITEPGTLDGGDVLKVGTTVYVGLSARTNADGLEQLRLLLNPLGWTVLGVPLTRVLHLKSAVTALPDGTIVGWLPAIDDPTIFGALLPMPEEGGAHVVDLGGGTLLMSNDCPRSAAIVRRRGFTVVTVDIGEFVKLEGCVTCLSVRFREQSEALRSMLIGPI